MAVPHVEIIDDIMADIWRNKTHREKFLIVCNMWSSARKLLTGYLKAEHPDWDDKRIHKEVVKRLSHGNV